MKIMGLLLSFCLAVPSVAQQVTGATTAPTLAKVKRIYVTSFGEDPASKLFQATVINALLATGRFAVTEKRERADAILEGTGVERTSHEVHAFGEGTAVGSGAGAARVDGDSGAAAAVGRSMAARDSSLDTETVQHATVAVRLVDRDGDVLWATTQQSDGGKYAGATEDAVAQCVKQLVRDMDRAQAAGKG